MTRVLIVDDSVFTREKIKQQLAQGGYEIIEAATAYGAIAKYKQYKPDITLLSIMIKRTPEYLVLEEILKSDPKAKVIIITSIGEKDKIDNCLNKGASDYLVKPLESGQIEVKIKKVLSPDKI